MISQKRAWGRSIAISAKPTPGERDHFRIADHAFSAGRTDWEFRELSKSVYDKEIGQQSICGIDVGSTVLAGAAAIEADDTSTVGRADRHKRHSLSGGNVHAIKPGCGGIIPDEKVFPVRSPSVDDVVAAKFWKSANLRSGHRVSLGRVAVHAKQHLAIR